MLQLSPKWGGKLAALPETGMGYQVVSVILKGGKRFEQVVIVEGHITEIRGIEGIPFSEEQIEEITVTHDKWNFDEAK